MQEKERIENFLNQVSLIRKMYNKINALSGEDFNVFNILRLSTREVRTHSAFIGELLNPYGCHGRGNVFLNHFVKVLKINDFECDNARIELEKHIGFISDSGEEGGSIDIIISDNKNRSIIIENKIYADDQKDQLLRYYNYGQKNYQPFYLLYLTLDGRPASNSSKGTLSEENYQRISYKDHIIRWLELCHQESSRSPLLRETIIQYINLIKILTHQTTYQEMEQEIEELLKANPDFIETLPTINSVADRMRSALIEKVLPAVSQGFDQVICTIDNVAFKVRVVNDPDGFQYCFFGYKNGEEINYTTYSNPFFCEKRESANNNGFNISGSPFFWKNFNNYPQRLEQLSYKEALMLNDQQIIEELKSEIREAIKFFKTLMAK